MPLCAPTVDKQQPHISTVLAQLVNMIEELKTDVAEVKKNVSEVMKDVSEVKKEVSSNTGKMDELQKEVAQLKKSVAEIMNNVSEVKNGGSEVEIICPIIRRKVAGFNRTGDWQALRKHLHAVLDRKRVAFKQLQLVKNEYPLCDVAWGNNANLARILLHAGLNVDLAGADGYTMLHWAATAGHDELVKLLLDFRADTEVKTKAGETPLVRAVYCNTLQVVTTLKTYGANINNVGDHKKSILHLAASSGNLQMVQYLVEAGASTSARDDENKTPLDYARQRYRADVVDYLSRLPE